MITGSFKERNVIIFYEKAGVKSGILLENVSICWLLLRVFILFGAVFPVKMRQ